MQPVKIVQTLAPVRLLTRRGLLTLGGLLTLVGLLSLAGLLSGGAQAAVITSIGSSSLPGASTGTIGPVGSTPAPNNDNAVAASPNVVPYSIFLNTPGAMEVEFIASNSGGTTEYRFTQNLINNTGQTWTGIRVELGFGLGADFVASTSDQLDFDTPDMDPAPSASAFSALTHTSDVLTWSGGSLPAIGGLQLTFSIDVPDNLDPTGTSGLARFTVRETPIVAAVVAEPSSALLMGSALFGALAVRRRARSARVRAD